GFRKSGPVGSEKIEASANSVTAKLVAGPLEVGVSSGTLALVLNQDGTKALDASGSLLFSIAGFASVTATSVRVKFNTTTTDYEATPLAINIDGVNATLAAALNTTSVSVTGLSAEFASFVTITGNFGFRKSGPVGSEKIEASANSVTAKLVAGPLEVGVSSGTLALVLNQDGTKALDASGSLLFSVAGFASVTATSVRVKFNTTTTDYEATPLAINIDGVNATLAAALNTTSVSVTGLSAEFASFVTIGGNFGFRKSGAVGSEKIEASANSVTAKLVAGPLEVGVSSGTLALVLNQDGTKALDASGSLLFSIAGFASVTATSVRVKFNTTTTDYEATPLAINIDGVNATLAAALN
ncbi:MAG: hypothetical protein ACREXQ_17910, partial [Polaromonas sp.]